MGVILDELVWTWPSLTLSDVHAALVYNYNHREGANTDIQHSDEFADKLRERQPSSFEKVRQRCAEAPDDALSSC